MLHNSLPEYRTANDSKNQLEFSHYNKIIGDL
jgi:hypothetical protein